MTYWLKNLAALAFGFVLALCILEAGLRIYNPFETRLQGDNIVLPSLKTYTFNNFDIPGLDSTIIHTKNALGFRGPDLPADGLENYLSVVTVGGSTTECFYLSDGHTWPDLLAAHLKKDWSQVWLNNAGLDGHSTFGHYILLRDFILPLQPDVILFLVGANDVGIERPTAHTADKLKGGIRLNSVEGFVKSMAAYSEIVSLALNGYRYLRARQQGLPHQQINIQAVSQIAYPEANISRWLNEHRQKYLGAYEERLRAMIHLTRREGIEPVLITQPALYGQGVDPLTGVDLGGLDIEGRSGYACWAILELYNDVIRSIGREEGILVIDLAREFPKNSALFYDYIHFTNEGAAAAAIRIYDDLKPYMEAHNL